MPEMLILAGLTALVASAALLLAVAMTALGRFEQARADVKRVEIVFEEARRMQRIGEQIAAAQRISETSLSFGSQLVRTLHQGIASIPFGILEAIPVTRHTTRLVRASHDLIAGAVYDSIDAVNREVGVQLRQQLDRSVSPPAQPAHAVGQGAATPGSNPQSGPDRPKE